MKDTLELAFLTDLNKTVHLQIPNPKTPISATDITTAMDAIVAANIFVFPTGRIVKKVLAKVNSSGSSQVTLGQ
ncbi:MAG: DUF2922 domain-containing protein [Acidibacillus sp.]|uniref:DUF2922 domain-containing protein n=1 Tax=Sulfoacidibacillus ferrooxidans TaxID=2005001 RepID=A0A9X2ACF2_9BACL|nr:DUF2922 domain-containing protein [Sulfoacidibacillus ferrooxidans]MCI0183714.1 hypothetical protein [Sulfoacidibacillus ferrooxidans]MCY0892246.1 DUF2922 domain-containing protein [Acidibacillus sp.]